MQVRIGVGLTAAALLSLAALSASATKSDGNGGGNAWGTQLGEMKSTASASGGNGNGHAYGLLLAGVKGKGGQREDADAQGEDERGEHVVTSPSLHVGKDALEGIDEHGHGDHHGPRGPQAGGDQSGPSEGGPPVTPPVMTPPVVTTPSDVAAVPEPSAALLFAAGTGLVLMALRHPQS